VPSLHRQTKQLIAWVNKRYLKFIEMDIDFEEVDCEDMPDLGLAGCAV
jgi:hypothetical protein